MRCYVIQIDQIICNEQKVRRLKRKRFDHERVIYRLTATWPEVETADPSGTVLVMTGRRWDGTEGLMCYKLVNPTE